MGEPKQISPIKKGSQLMAKPRMTKAERLFDSRISALVSANPEKRNGVSFIDRTALDYLKPEVKEEWLKLISTKSR